MTTGNNDGGFFSMWSYAALRKMIKAVKDVLPRKADLNASGKVPSSQLPSYIDETVEGYYYNDQFYEDAEHTQLITPESATIYVDIPTHRSYRWTGTLYLLVDNENELYVVPVVNMTTMGELREYINGINEQGLHVLLDMHTYLPDGYVCTVHMTTESGVQYCEIFDAVNIQGVAKGSYVDTDTITAFVAAGKSELATQEWVLNTSPSFTMSIHYTDGTTKTATIKGTVV